ncbi:MAG: ABC transporter ATP-binding protein [Chloroflexi bacterium]|nr:ABC transporter ATP-binding protein [Chloroflexota bacterium]
MDLPSPAISVQGLTKSYGAALVLRDMDLEVSWGQRSVLLGPNGSGKTTLIKVLATLARPEGGKVTVAGWDWRKEGVAIRRAVGVVTHQTLLYGDLTAHENLQFYGRMFGVPHLGQRIREAADQMGVARYLDRRVHTLSHGIQKRLSLARAILQAPRILLLDEPETGLDLEAQGYLESLLRSPGEDGSPRTVLLTTHNLERGLAWGDRVGVLAGGRVAYEALRGDLDVDRVRALLSPSRRASR